MKNQQLHSALLSRLKSDYGFKDKGDWFQHGKCPACGKREMYTRKDSPWVLRCGRQNKCGTEIHVKEQYPDLFADFNKRFKPTDRNPKATADAYMEMARGLKPELMTNWYEQGEFWHPEAVGNKQGTATVRFYLDRENDIFMERFVEPVDIREDDGTIKTRKAHFKGRYKGLWWQPPGMPIESGDKVYIVEGCIDAASLWLSGQKAVAALSCSNYPDKSLAKYQDEIITWVWALDNDRAGRKFIRKHCNRMRDAGFENTTAAVIPQKGKRKTDFNDAHQAGALQSGDLEEYEYQGKLLLEDNPMKKALLMWARTERNGFHFEHRNRLYWWELDFEKYNKRYNELKENEHKESDTDEPKNKEELMYRAAHDSGGLSQMANCYPEFLYFQVQELTDESWYYARIRFPHGAKDVKNTFTGAQLSAPTEFKKRLLSIGAGSMFTGTKTQLDKFLEKELYAIKTVDTVDFIGYSKEHQAYVLDGIAFKDGRKTEINDEDFYELGGLSIKSLNQSLHLTHGSREEYNTEWPNLIWECFGAQGMIAVAFWLGSLFAEQIRQTHKSYPFLEIVGEPGAGKSTLIEFMWKLVGRHDYEGFDPSKSTLAARSRNFSQVANLPVVLIEADRDEDTAKAKKFDWDELKTAYNGRASRSRGVKTGGNETYEPPFRGSIVISQNADVQASEAILQRIIHMKFNKAAHTMSSKLAAEKLEGMPVGEVSYFMELACRAESTVMDAVKTRTPEYEKTILGMDDVKSVRIAKNHAQLLSLCDSLAELIDLTEGQMQEIFETICNMAVARQSAISADHPVVAEFWNTFDYLNEGKGGRNILNKSSEPEKEIAFNFNHFVNVAANRKQQIPVISDLKRHLKASKSRKFIGTRTVRFNETDDHGDLIKDPHGALNSKTLRCWIFEAQG